MRFALAALACFVAGLFSLPCAYPATNPSPRELLAALNALRLDPHQVYTVSAADRVELRQSDVVLTFEEGKLAFYEPFEGRVTGVVFSGLGHALALPRDPVEKQQMARFLGAPVLDQQFVSAYMRFTDDTAQELLGQLARAGREPTADPSFTDLWVPQITRLNPMHSPRIVVERFSSSPRHFFHAGVDGAVTGQFDILIDQMRRENFMLGQPRVVNKTGYFDVWSSYSLPGSSPPGLAFEALRYHVSTAIHDDTSLEGDTAIDFRALSGGESLVFLQLARVLKVESIALASGESLTYFQNEGLTEQELRSRGDDTLCIFLPSFPRTGETFTLRLRYRGNVIENVGNDVLFVSARESWYPRFGDTSQFVLYDLNLRWPRRLRLVATGEKSDERDDGDFRSARWKTALPVPEAGFNLGEYSVASVPSENRTIEVYANRQLEQALLARLVNSAPSEPDPHLHISPVEGFPPPLSFEMPPPSPADALKSVAREVNAAIRFYEQFSGPFPFRYLGVSQIPGTFGQGWPGLLYLSTFSFLPHEAQQRVGLNPAGQAVFSDLVPVHEVAHQWWGNVVGWSSYRDQWITESIASYLALLFADSQKTADHPLHFWLEHYRKNLLTRPPTADLAPADVGPVAIGNRLSSSKSPEAYEEIVYAKGPWIIHMLHEMLRQPNSKDPDARFNALFQSLVKKYAQKPLSTAQFQREVEAVMTPKMALEGGHSMDWFFEQYVRGTGIPHYKVEFTSRRIDKGFQVRGKLFQSRVPRSFIAPVPLYSSAGAGRSVFLGTVVTSGEETSFSFPSSSAVHKLLIDPRMTLLCVPE
jgi:hypothetical protein